MSGVFADPPRGWTVQLLCDVALRALNKGRYQDADRLMRRMVTEVDERLEAGDSLDQAALGKVADVSVQLARASGATEWVKWCIAILRRSAARPTDDLVDQLAKLDIAALPDVLQALQHFTAWYRHHSAVRSVDDPSNADAVVLARLELLTGSVSA